jgi:hypothetical protein
LQGVFDVESRRMNVLNKNSITSNMGSSSL